MAQALGDVHGLLHAETLTFILAEQMQRPEAQDIVKDMRRRTVASGTPPLVLVATRFPQVDWHLRHSSSLLGQIPAEARTFAQRASRLK